MLGQPLLHVEIVFLARQPPPVHLQCSSSTEVSSSLLYLLSETEVVEPEEGGAPLLPGPPHLAPGQVPPLHLVTTAALHSRVSSTDRHPEPGGEETGQEASSLGPRPQLYSTVQCKTRTGDTSTGRLERRGPVSRRQFSFRFCSSCEEY